MTDETTDLRARVMALEEITDPDFIWGAMDNVHDMDVTLDDYAKAVSRAQRAALAASQPADPVTNAGCCQPVKVKPLVWEYYESNPHKICRAWCDALSKEWIIWIDCPDVEAEKAGIEQWRNDTILAALEAAPHVNETPKSEHDSADVLTAMPAATIDPAKVHGREMAYQAYINEMTPNGNSRMDNITICAGPNENHQRHIATQVDMAFQAGWRAALAALKDATK